ncbi:MAG: copper homeostasis protein CutC [Bacteroidales bacterium]|nr:copper homeostasis protein CutC [Bacteroidales bacterium]
MINVEICTPSLASAQAAKEGGAQRIELCRNLECGGLTPADDDIAYCVHKLGLLTHVLVRPRAGNFCNTPDEVAEIERTIVRCKALGAHAVVIGFLTADARIDVDLTRRMVQLAAPMEVTFHRAFDEACQDPLEALQAIISCGCTRLLTSGQAPTALEGADVIKHLVDYTHHSSSTTHRFQILAGSGVTPSNVCELIAKTGVHEVHGSCKTTLPDGTVQTDAVQVRQLIDNINSL